MCSFGGLGLLLHSVGSRHCLLQQRSVAVVGERVGEQQNEDSWMPIFDLHFATRLRNHLDRH